MLLQGLRAKYTQNVNCKNFLKSTGSKRIGEATRDKLYGIGMTLRNPNVLDVGRWETQGNLMGKCLEEIRSEL